MAWGTQEGRREDPKAFVFFGVTLYLSLLSLYRESCLGLGEFRGHLSTHMLLTSQWGEHQQGYKDLLFLEGLPGSLLSKSVALC